MIERSDTPYERYDVEPIGVASFDDYRAICNARDQFRKVGIQEKTAYIAAMNDTATVRIRLENGLEAPLLAPVRYEKMYEEERCREMMGRDAIYLVSLPDSAIRKLPEIPGGIGIIREYYNNEAQELSVWDELVTTGSMERFDFIHPAIGQSENSTAWMAAYTFDFSSVHKNKDFLRDQEEKGRIEALKQLRNSVSRRQSREPIPIGTERQGTFILFADDLREQPEIIDELWAISEIGFGKTLGAYHPVSMEFNRDFFDQMIHSDGSLVAVHYDNNKPACFGFIGLGLDNNDWIDTESTTLQQLEQHASIDSRELVHFYELISNGEAGMGYSVNILDYFISFAAETGEDYTVLFESTNLSSLYIPQIIQQRLGIMKDAVSSNGTIATLGKLHYQGLRTAEN